MNEVFRPAENIRINTRNSYLKLSHPFQKASTGQNGLSYIRPAIWSRIPKILKKTKNWNTFTHKMKAYYPNDLSNSNLSINERFKQCVTSKVFKYSQNRVILKLFLYSTKIFSWIWTACFRTTLGLFGLL